MTEPPASCFHLLAELRFHSDFAASKRWAGGYVNCWALAPSEEDARRLVIASVPKELRADVAEISEVYPEYPGDLEVEDEQGNSRRATADEIRQSFQENGGVIFGGTTVWRRTPWWQFWKRRLDSPK